MATTTEPSGKQKAKSKAEKKVHTTQASGVDKLKTVVRHLPPNLPEDVLWQSVQPWVTEETVSWKAFYPGKIRKKYNVNKENIPSRAYIAFRTMEQLAAFSQAYDGHVFRDKAGNESVAVVEFAPFQKVPPEKRKADTRMGTIEQDEDYKSFLASLNATVSKLSETETIEALVAASQPPEQPKTTPLLDALRAEKQAQRDKETILKAHAHYRDRAKEDTGARKKGKQAHVVPPVARDEATSGPGHGKRNRRGGKKTEPKASALATSTKEKDAALATSAKTFVKPVEKPASQQVSGKEGAKESQQERRPRPGLGTRQFEAALAGAGVLPGSGSDRKSRRERERERKPDEAATTEGAQKAADNEKEKVEKAQVPSSSGKDRSRGGRKRGDSTKGQTVPGPTNTGESISGPTPTILSRPVNQPGILTRPVPLTDSPASEHPVGETGVKHPIGGRTTPGEGRGGRRRGRGRGAVRGGTLGAGT